MPKNTQGLSEVESTGNKANRAKSKSNSDKKRANRFVTWVMGFIVNILPVVMCKVQVGLYHISGNTVKVAVYENFINDFIYSGSFLWISVAMLIMSLVELLFTGFNRKSTSKKKWWGKIVVFVAVVLILISTVAFYFSNIGDPYSKNVMECISWIAFVLHVILSGIISFIFV